VPAATPSDLDAILSDVAVRRGVDFHDYRRETLERGVESRRVATTSEDYAAYRARLKRDQAEVDRLVEALVVPVTSFFRDAHVFDALAAHVLPDLVGRLGHADRLRAWAIGVATGEEAWSLAMLLASAFGSEMPRFTLLGSDVDARSIQVAVSGRYAGGACATIPAALRARFVDARGGEDRVGVVLRECVQFVEHDVMGTRLAPREAVVASFHLVTMRNVLIYFDRRLQRKALERVTSVLEPGGVLVLGPVETLPRDIATKFVPYPGVDENARIFRRRTGAAR
jgi:chemotaxis methyl-accepting protein methylase